MTKNNVSNNDNKQFEPDINSSQQRYIFNSSVEMRIRCIELIKSEFFLNHNFYLTLHLQFLMFIIQDEIKHKSSKIIPIDQPAVLFDIPDHNNFGDSLIWYYNKRFFKT